MWNDAANEQDFLDRIISDWRRERPELDSAPMGLSGRILRLAGLLERRAERALEPYGLSVWQFDVLATLRRAGAPFSRSPTELARAVMLSPAAMTHRIDRLEKLGLVRRADVEGDRRSVRIELTADGLERIDRAIEGRFTEAHAVAELLPAEGRREVEQGLRALLLELEREE